MGANIITDVFCCSSKTHDEDNQLEIHPSLSPPGTKHLLTPLRNPEKYHVSPKRRRESEVYTSSNKSSTKTQASISTNQPRSSVYLNTKMRELMHNNIKNLKLPLFFKNQKNVMYGKKRAKETKSVIKKN